MTSTAVASAARCRDIRPHRWESLALRTLRLLESRIEDRILERSASRTQRRSAGTVHADRRADASARAHLGMLPE